ncbi:MAG: PAS domain-containing protein [Thermoleophilia bacterium]
MTTPAPTDQISPFAIDELFFSRTDQKGIIRSGNDVFVRVSRWDEADLVGAPHNVIRHPDMPRAVFRLLWDTLGAGQPIAAYVKNMARDGAYYWVMAAVVPWGDGYLSVRMKPTGPLFGAARAVYADIHALEQELESAGTPRKEVIDRSLEALLAALRDAGFATYRDFMRAALPSEIRAREEALVAMGDDGEDDALAETSLFLGRMFDGVGRYEEMHGSLASGLTAVERFAEDIRLGALNAMLAAAHLEGQAGTLSTIADLMGNAARDVAEDAAHLAEVSAPALERLHDLAFRMSLAKMQVDMARFFELEIATARGEGAIAASRTDDLRDLVAWVARETGDIMRVRGELDERNRAVRADVLRLIGRLEVLSALDVAGRIEIASIPGAGNIAALFDSVRAQLVDAADRLTGLLGAMVGCDPAITTAAVVTAAERAVVEAEALIAA